MFLFKKYESMLTELRICNSRLEDENAQLKLDLSKSRSEAASLSFELKDVRSKLDLVEAFIRERAPYFDLNTCATAETFEARQDLWASTWQHVDHNDPMQLVRQSRACEARFTPLEINPVNGVARFRGVESDYATSLTQCTCMDFQRHLRPCKHMYRLAYELDVYMLDDSVNYVPEPQKFFRLDQLQCAMQKLSPFCKDTLAELKRRKFVVAKRYDVGSLLSSGLAEICPDKHPLLDTYRREELLSLLPEDISVKRSAKKSDIIDIISSSCPNVITDLEKITVAIQLSPYVAHLRNYI